MLSKFALQHVLANVNFKTIRTYIPSSMQQGFTHHIFLQLESVKRPNLSWLTEIIRQYSNYNLLSPWHEPDNQLQL